MEDNVAPEVTKNDNFQTYRKKDIKAVNGHEQPVVIRKSTITRRAPVKRNSKINSVTRNISFIKDKASNDAPNIISSVDNKVGTHKEIKNELYISVDLESDKAVLDSDKPSEILEKIEPIYCEPYELNRSKVTSPALTEVSKLESSIEFSETHKNKQSLTSSEIRKMKLSKFKQIVLPRNTKKIERTVSYIQPVTQTNSSNVHRNSTFKLANLNYYKSSQKHKFRKAVKVNNQFKSLDQLKSSGHISISQRIQLMQERNENRLTKNKVSTINHSIDKTKEFWRAKEEAAMQEIKEKEEMKASIHNNSEPQPTNLDYLPPTEKPINTTYTIAETIPIVNSSQLTNTSIDSEKPKLIKLSNLSELISKKKKLDSDSKKRVYSTLTPIIVDEVFTEMVEQYITDKEAAKIKKLKLKVRNKNKKDMRYLDKHNPVKMLLHSERSIIEAIYQWFLDLCCDQYMSYKIIPEIETYASTKHKSKRKEIKEKHTKTNKSEVIATPKITSIFNDQEWESLKTLNKAVTSTENDEKYNSRTRGRSVPYPAKLITSDEMKSYQDLKQTLLKYEAKIRQLINDKSEMVKELDRKKDHNTNLQKRQYTLQTEFKQEKREISFIKTQIGIMVSRIQTLPDKIEKLEAENVNLKSELKDAEQTLAQRDQLFASERQINASLSEEIIKLESESVNKDLMKNVCEEFENLNEEYEDLKTTLATTEDKLYELAEDRDNLLKHSKILEDHLFKLKAENNYYQLITSKSNGAGDNNAPENTGTNTKPPEEHHHCRRSKSHRRYHRSCSLSSSTTCSSSTSSSSSSVSPHRHSHHRRSKRRHHRGRHKHNKSRGRRRHRHKKRSRSFRNRKLDLNIATVNGDTAANDKPKELKASDDHFVMPSSLEELRQLENIYDNLQVEKNRLQGALSHIPTSKGISGSGNLTNLREQEGLEYNLDIIDKKLASLRKILKQCKVFKSITS